MKTILIIAAVLITLTSCTKNKVYNVTSITYGNESVISSEPLIKGDTVRIGYDIGGREIAYKELHGYNYIGHIAIVN